MFRDGSRILRCVFPHAAENLRKFLSSDLAQGWAANGELCSTTVLSGSEELPQEVAQQAEDGAVVVEHRPIPFPNYPYEWPPEMLRAAAEMSVRLASEALHGGFVLKDATPYNVMFDGARPVFLDVLSFESRDSLDAIWPPYAQFVRTFVYPLIASRECGVEIGELLLTHRDGLKPERMARLLGWKRWMPRFFAPVALPALFSKNRSSLHATAQRKAQDAREAEFILDSRFRKALRMLPEIPANGAASAYMQNQCTYSPSQWSDKDKAIAEILDRFEPRNVLDIGCNSGHFSLLAARHGAHVVAIDREPAAIGALFKSALKDALPVLPLVVDIARPSAACGWENSECLSFLDRARDRFDCVLMLALAHHLIADERVPLNFIFELAYTLTRRLLVIEYVDPSDAQFVTVARGRDALYAGLHATVFENAASVRFRIVASRAVTPTRTIYTLERKRT